MRSLRLRSHSHSLTGADPSPCSAAGEPGKIKASTEEAAPAGWADSFNKPSSALTFQSTFDSLERVLEKQWRQTVCVHFYLLSPLK